MEPKVLDSYGTCWTAETPQACSKVGMLKSRRPVVTHAWPTSCGPRRLSACSMESEHLQWNSTFFFLRVIIFTKQKDT